MPDSAEANVKSILEWLALNHGQEQHADPEQLYRQLLLLRETAIPTTQHVKLLDLLYQQAERIIEAQRPILREALLPISRRLRQQVRLTLKLLEALTQDYFNTLAALFDPLASAPTRSPQNTLHRVMRCLSWQIRINHLIAAPASVGLWQQLHAAFRNARRLGIATQPGLRDGESIQELYVATLLEALAQPASFCPEELDLIGQYIETRRIRVEFTETPPAASRNAFWIDLDKDFPAHALIRRSPAADIKVLYFCCSEITQEITADLTHLNAGKSAASLELPAYAETRSGQRALTRLATLLGQPAKRKFPRRRQSYRTHLCVGFKDLWHLLDNPAAKAEISEWMVINESPDGYALMHMTGQTNRMRVGEIVALQAISEEGNNQQAPWHICIVRWALSENPEHLEVGLQLISPHATAARIAQPQGQSNGSIEALILPETIPLRLSQSLVVPTGLIASEKGKIIVLVENNNLEIREVRATNLDEQTNSIEVFSVSPDATT